MTTLHQEIVQNPEHEAKEADRSSQEEIPCEMTKEIFRREMSPSPTDDAPAPEPLKSPKPRLPIIKPVVKPPSTKTDKVEKKSDRTENAAKKKSSSGIPLRLKPAAAKNPAKTYRHTPSAPGGHVINKNTLEVQFINNRKRLLQLHSELLEKQRPLMEMHKSLLRTKKQLEEMGKKVALEDLKVISLKTDDTSANQDGAGENPAAETAMNLKNSIENALDECVKACKKCFVERDHVVKILESASKSTIPPEEIEAEVEEILKEKDELQRSVETAIKENEKKVEDIINNWQKMAKTTGVNSEMAAKITELEETVKTQQKTLQESDDNIHSLNRKLEEKKVNYEKTITDLQDKNNKLEEEVKKERRNANEQLMKSRTMRGKLTEMETKSKESEAAHSDVSQKLKQLQEQMRRKEVQWVKEREDFKKNEALLQQKFTEKQSQFDTRLEELENLQMTTEQKQQNFYRNFETQLEIKDQEFALLETEKDVLAQKTKLMGEQVEEMKKQLEEKEKEIEDFNTKHVPAIEFKIPDSHWLEVEGYKHKIEEAQLNVDHLNDQVSKMQNSLKTHAKLAAALKLEKDKAMEYSNKLRDVLQEARDELQYKTKIIYKIHEKLVLREKENEKLQAKLKDLEANTEVSSDRWSRNRCQICMSTMAGADGVETEVGKCSITTTPQYVSESLIGMSVKKVDHLRARLDNLKKMKLPLKQSNRTVNVKYSWPQPREAQPISGQLRKQIELRGKLYQILQKHADQSCEDFINLLKLTVAGKGGSDIDELKPSNNKSSDDKGKNFISKFSANMTESISAFSHFGSVGLADIYDKLHESANSDNDEFV